MIINFANIVLGNIKYLSSQAKKPVSNEKRYFFFATRKSLVFYQTPQNTLRRKVFSKKGK